MPDACSMHGCGHPRGTCAAPTPPHPPQPNPHPLVGPRACCVAIWVAVVGVVGQQRALMQRHRTREPAGAQPGARRRRRREVGPLSSTGVAGSGGRGSSCGPPFPPGPPPPPPTGPSPGVQCPFHEGDRLWRRLGQRLCQVVALVQDGVGEVAVDVNVLPAGQGQGQEELRSSCGGGAARLRSGCGQAAVRLRSGCGCCQCLACRAAGGMVGGQQHNIPQCQAREAGRPPKPGTAAAPEAWAHAGGSLVVPVPGCEAVRVEGWHDVHVHVVDHAPGPRVLARAQPLRQRGQQLPAGRGAPGQSRAGRGQRVPQGWRRAARRVSGPAGGAGANGAGQADVARRHFVARWPGGAGWAAARCPPAARAGLPATAAC